MNSTPTTLQLLQYNVNKQKPSAILHPLLQSLNAREIHIVAIQEPPEGPTLPNCPHYHPIRPTGDIARVGFYVSTWLDPNTWTFQDTHPDFCTITLHLTDGPIHIHNLYNPPLAHKGDTTQATLDQIPQALHHLGEHILLGDFNLHHAHWGGTHITDPHALAAPLISLAQQKGMELATPRGMITRERKGTKSTLDLTFISENIWEQLIQCQVNKKYDHGSDHYPIHINLDMKPTPTPPSATRSWKKANWPAIQEHLERNFPQHLNQAPKSTEDVDQQIQDMQELLQEATSTHVPLKKPSTRSKRNWSPELQHLIKEARRARRAAKKTDNEEDWNHWKHLSNKKRNLSRKDSNRAWRILTEQATQDHSHWRLMEWARNRQGIRKPPPQFPDMRPSVNAPLVQTTRKKGKVLAQKFFPASKVPSSHLPHGPYPEPIPIPQGVAEEDIQAVLNRLHPDRAPGPDGITNRYLKTCSETLIPWMTRTFGACLSLQWFPSAFKTARTIVLRKPQKEDYTLPGAYRPIALLNTMGKVLETLLASRLAKATEEHHLLPATQMGARKGRSTETAILLLTEQIHTTWQTDSRRVASILSLDQAGAYDTTPHPRVIHSLQARRIPHWMTQIIRMFLLDRETELCLGPASAGLFHPEAGIPQGSALSPILFLFFAGDLLDRIENEGGSSCGFMDDTNILVEGSSTTDTCQQLTQIHETCLEWAVENGAQFAPDKYQITHFTRRPKKHNMDATPNIPDFPKKPSPSIKILGIHLDSKLSWFPHLKKAKAKGESSGKALNRLTASTWGIPLVEATRVYQAVTRSQLTYGSNCWYYFNGHPERKVTLYSQLHSLQTKGLKKTTGAFRRTATALLEVESSTPPLELFMEAKAIKFHTKLNGTEVEELIQAKCRQIIARQRNNHRPSRTRPQSPTPRARTKTWAQEQHRTILAKHQKPEQTTTLKTVAQHHIWDNWKAGWDQTYPAEPIPSRAHYTWSKDRVKLYKKLTRAQGSLAIQLRSGKIGLRAYLFEIQARDIDSPRCSCGWRQQTIRHILFFCPKHQLARAELWNQIPNTDLKTLLANEKHLKTITRWMIKNTIIEQYRTASFLQQQLEHAENTPTNT